MSSPKQFGLAVQNPVRVQRVAAISPIGAGRGLLWRRRLSNAVDERRDERGVAPAGRAGRVRVANGSCLGIGATFVGGVGELRGLPGEATGRRASRHASGVVDDYSEPVPPPAALLLGRLTAPSGFSEILLVFRCGSEGPKKVQAGVQGCSPASEALVGSPKG